MPTFFSSYRPIDNLYQLHPAICCLPNFIRYTIRICHQSHSNQWVYIMFGLWEAFSNWWWPQPESVINNCGNIVGAVGDYFNYPGLQTPAQLQTTLCTIQETTGFSLPVIGLVGAGIFVGRGGPKWAWDKVRHKKPGELLQDAFFAGVKTYFYAEYGTKYAALVALVEKAMDNMIPDLVDQKKRQKLELDLKKIQGKAQKAQFAAAMEEPEAQAALQKSVQDELAQMTATFIKMFAKEIEAVNDPIKQMQMIEKGLKQYLIDGTLPNLSADDEITPVHQASSSHSSKL